MTTAKVLDSTELAKLKIELAKTAKKCCCDGCEKIGRWSNDRQGFYLYKGMCHMHYKRVFKYGDSEKVLHIIGEDRSSNPIYVVYYGIKSRCYNKAHTSYPIYGGRGITMSDEWFNDFNQFERDMGKRPSPHHSIERRKVNEGYSKDNCYWATRHQQAANKRTSNNTVGVSNQDDNKWRARLNVNKIKVLDEQFSTYEEAVQARKDAEKLHGIVY